MPLIEVAIDARNGIPVVEWNMSEFELHQDERFGFYSVRPLPTRQELAAFYEQLYYQSDTGPYSKRYSTEEVEYFQIECQVLKYLYLSTFPNSDRRVFLDVGCGEGYQANFFHEHNWQVTCVDYSDFGLKTHHPHLTPNLIKGEFESVVAELVEQQSRFSVILLKNILEHVIDPSIAIEQLKTLMDDQTMLCIDVPNDYSPFQAYLLEQGFTENTWFGPPQHLHYFQFDSLRAFLEAHGLSVVSAQAEFAIEQFLVNEHSNYAKNRELGAETHLSRCRISNFLLRQGVEKFIKLREAYADLEFGRGISMVVKLSSQ